MFIGEIFRYSKPYEPTPQFIDGLPNYFASTFSPNCNRALLESGINPITEIQAIDGKRRPAILISSSPNKTGSIETPWQDFFDPDNGHIFYHGDNKVQGIKAENASGNKVLLETFDVHNTSNFNIRKNSVPVIFFKRVKLGNRIKGNVMFQGFGVLNRIERITQVNGKTRQYFSNYAFHFTVLNMIDEGENFDWEWITKRRDPNLTIDETLKYAPSSWKSWIKEGPSALERNRRRASVLQVTKSENQKPEKKSTEEKALFEIYNYYSSNQKMKKRFEGLASFVAGRILRINSSNYIDGWITPATSDGGSDFISRLDLGSGFSKVKLIVLGQAKCEDLDTPTNGNDIARTVARLKRGWIGVYVTTSYFSIPVQREIIEDEYPIVLINGKRLAIEVLKMAHEEGYTSVTSYLKMIDQTYDGRVQNRRPEEILLS